MTAWFDREKRSLQEEEGLLACVDAVYEHLVVLDRVPYVDHDAGLEPVVLLDGLNLRKMRIRIGSILNGNRQGWTMVLNLLCQYLNR